MVINDTNSILKRMGKEGLHSVIKTSLSYTRLSSDGGTLSKITAKSFDKMLNKLGSTVADGLFIATRGVTASCFAWLAVY